MSSARLVSILVVLAAATLSSCGPARTTDHVTISFHFSHFEPGAIRVATGVPVQITLRNDDPIEHEWIIGPAALHDIHRVGTEAYHEGRPNEVTVPAYATRTTTLTFDRPGEYEYICHLPGHEAYGMKGLITVA